MRSRVSCSGAGGNACRDLHFCYREANERGIACKMGLQTIPERVAGARSTQRLPRGTGSLDLIRCSCRGGGVRIARVEQAGQPCGRGEHGIAETYPTTVKTYPIAFQIHLATTSWPVVADSEGGREGDTKRGGDGWMEGERERERNWLAGSDPL